MQQPQPQPMGITITYDTLTGRQSYYEVVEYSDGAYHIALPEQLQAQAIEGSTLIITTDRPTQIPVAIRCMTAL